MNEILAMILIVIIVVALIGVAYFLGINILTNDTTSKSAFSVCDSFCQCGSGNLTILTYSAKAGENGYDECKCLVSQFSNTTAFRDQPIYIVSDNYTCGETK